MQDFIQGRRENAQKANKYFQKKERSLSPKPLGFSYGGPQQINQDWAHIYNFSLPIKKKI